MVWILPWLIAVRSTDLRRPDQIGHDSPAESPSAVAAQTPAGLLAHRYLALVVTVIMINMTWQYFRVWLPKFLREYHGYERTAVNLFTSAYYISTDAGCILSGFAVKYLTMRGMRVHRSRMLIFFVCSLLTALAACAALLPRGPLLLVLLLLVGFGSLGLFPNYYSLTQEISYRRQGMVTGSLGAITWVVTSIMQKYVGRSIDETQSYAAGIFAVGFAPLVAFLVLLVLWRIERSRRGRFVEQIVSLPCGEDESWRRPTHLP